MLTASTRADDFVPPSIEPGALLSSYDIVVAGAGTGGLGAAIQAARMGVAVLLLEETDWIGGQALAAAVSAMDEGGAGNLVRGRGLYRELLQRVEGYYRPLGLDPFAVGPYTNTRFEPRVGRRLLHAMLKEAGGNGRLDLMLRAHVTKVHRAVGAVSGADLEFVSPHGRETRTVSSTILIDATEWGDVLPLTGAAYRGGNRTSDALDFSRLTQENTWTAVIKQYPGGVPVGFRITHHPPGYEKMQPVYAAHVVPGDAPFRRGGPMSWKAFVDYRGMPNSALPQPPPLPLTRTHLNAFNDYPCSVGYLQDPAQRVATDRAMRLRTLQLLHYLQNELGMSDWSVADDEGFDSPYNRGQIDAWLRDQPEMEPYRKILYHFSVIPYVRESRRLIGLHTLLAREISRGPGKKPTQFPSTICLADYRLDLHGGKTRENLELDLDRIEDLEDAVPGRAGPFAIPMECLVPVTLDGFLAAEKNYSQTRLVNGATRMQPHTLNLGQAVGALAALAVRHGVPPRQIDPVLVQRALLAAGSTLQITPLRDVAQESHDWPAIQLVTVQGMLPLEEGRFFPPRSVSRAELDLVVQRLGGRASAQKANADTVTRAVFAEVLTALGSPEVNLGFTSGGTDAARSITRSEAAQVLAEFMEARALGRLRGVPQTMQWNSIRPASRATGQTDSALSRQLQLLVGARIIADAAYWNEHAVDGRECEGARVAGLLLNAARLLEPEAAAQNAVEVLARARIISAPEYWAKSAVPGGRCAGKNVATVIRNLAANFAVLKRTGARSTSH
ncbi:MAG: FAD-dependent oxidoreductase [Opitutaceae bacterium]|nr:FAD-dependent oxidoreductase [Opitutaceae bacterium]